MNKIFLILTLLFVSTIQSQNIERNDLIGEWVFKVNIKDAIKIMLDIANHLFSSFIFQYLSSFKLQP